MRDVAGVPPAAKVFKTRAGCVDAAMQVATRVVGEEQRPEVEEAAGPVSVRPTRAVRDASCIPPTPSIMSP